MTLSNLLWAFATSNIYHPGLFTAIGDEIMASNILDLFAPQTISNTVWAYATANICHPGLLERVGDAVLKSGDMASFKHQELSNMVWAYATCNVKHTDLFDEVARAIVKREDLKSFKEQTLSNVAWSYAVTDAQAPSLFNDVFIKALVHRQHKFTVEALSQLHQWNLWQTMENSSDGLPESLQHRCHEAFVNQSITVSPFQKDVALELRSIGLDPVEEHVIKSGYALDVLVEIDGKKIGVEADGPSHFVDKKANGSTMLKRRQVAAIDEIKLVSVPYWEWDELGNDRSKKQQYLRVLLDSTKKEDLT
jgi:hypothetical protein